MSNHVHCCDEVDYDSVAEQAIATYLASPEFEKALVDAFPDDWPEYRTAAQLVRVIAAAMRERA